MGRRKGRGPSSKARGEGGMSRWRWRLPPEPNNQTSLMSSASSQHSLFIFGHTRWSIHIILSTNNRLFLPVCFPRLWNQLPASLCHPRTNLSNFDSPSPSSGTSSIGSIDSPLLSSKPLLSFSGETPRIPRTVYRYF